MAIRRPRRDKGRHKKLEFEDGSACFKLWSREPAYDELRFCLMVTMPRAPSSFASACLVKSFSRSSRPRIQSRCGPATEAAGDPAASPPHCPSAADAATISPHSPRSQKKACPLAARPTRQNRGRNRLPWLGDALGVGFLSLGLVWSAALILHPVRFEFPILLFM